MNDFVRAIIVVAIALLIAAIPFLLFAGGIEKFIQQWMERAGKDNTPVTLTIITLLAADIFLPIPSSGICTLAGSLLGGLAGTVTAWIGLTSGAVIGYLTARLSGHLLVRRVVNDPQTFAAREAVDRYGPAAIVLLRAVPLLAEASVLLAGFYRQRFLHFLAAVGAANLGLAAAYAYLGHYAQRQGWLPVALAASLGIPVLLLIVAARRGRRWPATENGDAAEPAAR